MIIINIIIIIVFITGVLIIVMANVAITQECRDKLSYVRGREEFLRDTIERLVDGEIKRQGIKIPE